jgi:hypothetical protein
MQADFVTARRHTPAALGDRIGARVHGFGCARVGDHVFVRSGGAVMRVRVGSTGTATYEPSN